MAVSFLILAILLIVGGLGGGDSLGTEFAVDRVNEFKSRIGFYDIVNTVDAETGVVLGPLDAQAVLSLKDWRIVEDSISFQKPGLVKRSWFFAKESSGVGLDIVVSSIKPTAAFEELVNFAGATMTVEIPFVRGPKELGQLSVKHKNPNVHDVIWAYQNVCVRINAIDVSLDVIKLAQALDRLLRGRLVNNVQNYKPYIERITVSPEHIRVGNLIHVEIHPRREPSSAQRMSEIIETQGQLEQVSQNALSASFRAKSPGQTEIYGMLADRATLLSASATVVVKILAPNSPQ